VTHERAIWAAFLTPQGRYLHDFFVCHHLGDLLLEGEAARLADLRRRLLVYRLRSRVTVDDASDMIRCWALIGDGAAAAVGLVASEPGAARPLGRGIAFIDPRLREAGVRALLPTDAGAQMLVDLGFVATDQAEYDRLRIGLGLPDGSRDILIDKSLLLECGFEELGGIDWNKGCFLGQELTARTRYRGLVKRRLVPVSADGPLPPPGTPIVLDGKDVGEVRSGIDGSALALLRVDALHAAAAGISQIHAGETRLMPKPPAWAKFIAREQT
jgi:folate-binding protein YgfZ